MRPTVIVGLIHISELTLTDIGFFDQVELFLGKHNSWVAYMTSIDLERWIMLFEECWQYLRTSVTVHSMLYCSQIVRQILAMLHLRSNNASTTERYHRYMELAIQYMSRHLDHNISLDELSSYMQLSKPAFNFIIQTIDRLPADGLFFAHENTKSV